MDEDFDAFSGGRLFPVLVRLRDNGEKTSRRKESVDRAAP